MSKVLYNIVLPNNNVETVGGVHNKAFIAIFHRHNLPSVVSTIVKTVSAVWEVIFLNRLLYKLDSPKSTSIILMATKGKFINSVHKKCEQCPILTTHDLHSESDHLNRPQCKGVINRLGIKEVKFKYPLNAGM